MPIHPDLFQVLACPVYKTPLQWDKEKDELISVEAGLAYPIRDQIPIMLTDEARQLSDEELKKWKKKSPPENTQ
jgi:uncharacterized protein YbaR (Trm112 family)